MRFETKRAEIAYALSDISKPTISKELFDELVSDFEKTHKDLVVRTKIRNPDPFGWNVVISGVDEDMKLYEEWNQTFAQHGYQPPFLTIVEHDE